MNQIKQQALLNFLENLLTLEKTSSTLVTVPDHVVTSFHGAKDMIQLPPCFIESVNVTYNPNNSSFFKRNNAPVEIGLSVSLKEIVPIYARRCREGVYNMYFSNIINVAIDIDGSGNLDLMKNLTAKAKVSDALINNAGFYNTIEVMEGERPDHLSQRLYGTPDFPLDILIT